MGNRAVVEQYLRCFCAGDVEGIAALLAPELKFRGTLGTYQSAREYIAALRSDPPQKAGASIVSITEADDSVAVFYEYQRPEKTITIAQLFTLADERIQEMLVVFDGRGFT